MIFFIYLVYSKDVSQTMFWVQELSADFSQIRSQIVKVHSFWMVDSKNAFAFQADFEVFQYNFGNPFEVLRRSFLKNLTYNFLLFFGIIRGCQLIKKTIDIADSQKTLLS